jgi:glycosyltransferase involved in cell wall biosynthesis
MITIALLTYNRPHYLRLAIEAILNQTFKDFELLICDNGSERDTIDVIAIFTDTRIRVIRNELNSREFYNYAFTQKTRPLILITHDDDIMKPDYLEMLVPIIHNSDIVALGCNAEYINSSSEVTGIHPYYGEASFITITKNFIHEFFNDRHPICPTVIMKKDFFDLHQLKMEFKVGLAFDIYLWNNVIHRGGKIGILNKPLYQYRLHDNQDSMKFAGLMQSDLFKIWLTEDNSLSNIEKLMVLNKIVKMYLYSIRESDLLLRDKLLCLLRDNNITSNGNIVFNLKLLFLPMNYWSINAYIFILKLSQVKHFISNFISKTTLVQVII